MTGRSKILARIGIGIAAVLVLLIVSAIVIVQTNWFKNFVREKIVSAIEDATGGKVNLKSFAFGWTNLQATITDLTIHGTEPPGNAPLVNVQQIVLRLKLFSSGHAVDLAYLGVTRPSANVIVFANGKTNLPTPKKAHPKSNNSALQTIVDLAVNRFDISHGVVRFADRKIQFSADGRNLTAQLLYDSKTPEYKGAISINPLYLSNADRKPVEARVRLPISIGRDSVQLSNANISTPGSKIDLSARLTHLESPVVDAELNAKLSLAEVQQASGAPIYPGQNGAPSYLVANFNGHMDDQTIRVSSANIDLGDTRFQASGLLKDLSQAASLRFSGNVALKQLASLMKISIEPTGAITLGGNARFNDPSDYLVTGNIGSRNLSLRDGKTVLRDISISSAVKADPHVITLNDLKLLVLGGGFYGNADLRDSSQLQVRGQLRNFDLQALSTDLAGKHVGYGGVISGPLSARGNLKAKGATGFTAQARLAITPESRGVPVSGRLDADYSGATALVSLDHSYIALPHSRLDLSGVLGRRMALQLTSTNLNDFLPAVALASSNAAGQLPVTLRGGRAHVTADINGSLSAPDITAHASATHFAVENRQFDNFTADLAASPSGASVKSGLLASKGLAARFGGSVGLHHWSSTPESPLSVNATIQNADLADVMALAGQKEPSLTGNLKASANIRGTVGSPQGTATVSAMNGTVDGEPFDRFDATARLSDRLVRLAPVAIAAGAARVNLSGTFAHPHDSFSSGHLTLEVASNQIDLAQFKVLQQKRPGLAGIVQIVANAAADMHDQPGQPRVALQSLNGSLAASNVRDKSGAIGGLNARAQTIGNHVRFDLNSSFAGSAIKASGQTTLASGYSTTANASIQNLQIEKALTIADLHDIPASGTLGATASFSGTLNDPHANLTATLAKAVVYDEPVTQLHGSVEYSNTTVNIPELRVDAPAGQIQMNGSLAHAAGDFKEGQLKLHIESGGIEVARVQHIQEFEPGLGGVLEMVTDVAATLHDRPGQEQVLLSRLDATVAAKNIALNKQPFGGATFQAKTSGNTLSLQLDSDFAKSKIHGSGQAQLSGNYPIKANLTFSDIKYSNLKPFLAAAASTTRSNFDGQLAGQLSMNGPVTKPEDLNASLQLSQLQLTAAPREPQATAANFIVLQNQQPIVAELNHSVVTVKSAHLTGRDTDITIGGTAALQGPRPLKLDVNAKTNLSLLQAFNRDLYSSGELILQAAIRGQLSQPQVNGKLALQNASMNLASIPNGISNANGVILLHGTSAVIQNLTAQSGGGKISADGFAALTGHTVQYSVRAKAERVRTRYSGASLINSASISLSGNSEHSLLGGDVTVEKIAFNPQSDFGSLLSKAGTPPQTPSAPSGALAGMRLDLRIRTAPDVQFQTALAQSLQGTADLRLRGTAASPGMTGRVVITQGKLVFFGNQYTVNRGTISFYNPLDIEPVLDISLETKAQGVEVVLGISGHIENMKLSYRSDPPLRFDEIVALLATGRTPSSDPTIAAHQPIPPQQSVAQMGESAIVSQAVAAPLANRLQRVFGVSEIKIDPTFAQGSSLPQARVTLQQQITPTLTFTYTTDVTQTNDQLIKVEWAISPRLSAVATRDEYGFVSIDFFVKRHYR
jgi:translocation and assembly module TamB